MFEWHWGFIPLIGVWAVLWYYNTLDWNQRIEFWAAIGLM